MQKVNTGLFAGKEVVFVGYSEKNNAFSKMIYQAFSNNGIKVYPVNHKENATFEVKVYKSIVELPKIPECAYILLNKDNTRKMVKSLAGQGIKRILFHSKNSVDEELLNECKGLGIETAIGCPMMVYGTGFHRIHAFFAGVKR